MNKKESWKVIIKRSSLQILFSVQYALFLRELSMRFSEGRLGLFWTFVEPFFQILVLILIKMAFFSTGQSSFDFSVFLALNFIAFNMFKNIVLKSSNAFEANSILFIYKQVKPIDTILARVMVELFITAIIILFFLIIGFYFEFNMEVKDLTMVTCGFFFLILFSFAVALFISVLSVFVNSISKLLGFFMTALMFLSAIFYSIESLPTEMQTFLLYNPLIHFIEMIHGFYFFALDDRFVSYNYMSLWTCSLLYIGLWFYIKLEKRIISL